MDAWTELLRFPNAPAAQLIAGFLKGEGIHVELFGVHVNNVLPHLHDSAVGLMVRETQLRKARELLESGAHRAFVSETAMAMNEVIQEDARPPKPDQDPDAAFLPADVELRRAAACAVLGFFFLPGISSLFALYFLFRAFRAGRFARPESLRYRVALTLAFAAAGLAFAFFLLRAWLR